MMLTAFNKAMFLVTRVALVLITLAITCPISIILGMDPPPNIVIMLIEGMDKSLGDVLSWLLYAMMQSILDPRMVVCPYAPQSRKP